MRAHGIGECLAVLNVLTRGSPQKEFVFVCKRLSSQGYLDTIRRAQAVGSLQSSRCFDRICELRGRGIGKIRWGCMCCTVESQRSVLSRGWNSKLSASRTLHPRCSQALSMSWHERSCGIPNLSWAGGYPTCIRCGSSASSIANGSVVTPPPPAPPPCPKRSQLICSWPPCVEYSNSYIDEKGNDVTAFITQNIDGWKINQFEPPDDQTNFQEVREASQHKDGSSETPGLSRECLDTTKTDASDEVAQSTHDKTHTVASGPTSTYYSDRIHENLSGANDFRLLRLYGSASFDDQIHCSLEVARLDDPDVPLYEALSYTWADLNGDKRNCMPIYIGSHFDVLLVTRNCQSALRRLRKRFDRLLWIDAICINQNDSRERSEQVNHMTEIYSTASRVLIYLGEESNGSVEAHPMVTPRVRTSAIRKDTTFLVELAKTPYFKRLWIIQEIALANRVSVIYGDLVMYWNDLCSAFESCGVAPEWIKHFSAPLGNRGKAPSVLELLWDTRDALCIDPRDKVFGIIGLANTVEREMLPTDYSLSTQQLYIGLAAYLIQKTTNHSFLNLAYNQKKVIPGLPSWVPDWTNIKIQGSGQMMPELLVRSQYAAFPPLFWRVDAGKIFESGSINASSNSRKMKLLMSPPLVQHTAGALLPFAVPLFTISRAELKVNGVSRRMRITYSKLLNNTDELEIFAIPSCTKIAILRKHSAGIFALQGSISIVLDPLGGFTPLCRISEQVCRNIHIKEYRDIQRWLCVVLGLHFSSNFGAQDSAGRRSTHKAAVFPDLPHLKWAEESLGERYQKSDRIGFNSGHFEAMDQLRMIMLSAIDPEDLAWHSPIPSCLEDWRANGWSFGKMRSFAEELPARQKSVEEQINTWSSSIAQLKSQLHEHGSFSDTFRDLQADDFFCPIFLFNWTNSGFDNCFIKALGLSDAFKSVKPNFLHLSSFLQKACSVISCATLDEGLPWEYNRDRFWMCMVSFDLIVRLRLLLADRQLYSHMDRSISSSIATPKRIVII